jgi:hypothetical protein
MHEVEGSGTETTVAYPAGPKLVPSYDRNIIWLDSPMPVIHRSALAES